MSKRCIRPLVAADVALSSRLPAPGAGAGNAAIRTGDRMVPPAAHFESLPPGCRPTSRPHRRPIFAFSVDDRPLPASARTGGRRAPPRLPPGCRSALRLPPFAVRTAFAAPPFGASRRADMIRRSTPASDFRSGAAKSDTRFAPADGRYAPSRLTTGVCPLPLGQATAWFRLPRIPKACLRAAVLRFGCRLSRFGAGQRLLPDRAPPRSPAPRRREDNE